MLRIPLPAADRYRVFYSRGFEGTVGVSPKTDGGVSCSLGMGIKADRFRAETKNGQRNAYGGLISRRSGFYAAFHARLGLHVGLTHVGSQLGLFPGR